MQILTNFHGYMNKSHLHQSLNDVKSKEMCVNLIAKKFDDVKSFNERYTIDSNVSTWERVKMHGVRVDLIKLSSGSTPSIQKLTDSIDEVNLEEMNSKGFLPKNSNPDEPKLPILYSNNVRDVEQLMNQYRCSVLQSDESTNNSECSNSNNSNHQKLIALQHANNQKSPRKRKRTPHQLPSIDSVSQSAMSMVVNHNEELPSPKRRKFSNQRLKSNDYNKKITAYSPSSAQSFTKT